jgi:hypothetical protein
VHAGIIDMDVYVLTVENAGLSTFHVEAFTCGILACKTFEQYVDEELTELEEFYNLYSGSIDRCSNDHQKKFNFVYDMYDDGSAEFHLDVNETSMNLRRVKVSGWTGIKN